MSVPSNQNETNIQPNVDKEKEAFECEPMKFEQNLDDKKANENSTRHTLMNINSGNQNIDRE